MLFLSGIGSSGAENHCVVDVVKFLWAGAGKTGSWSGCGGSLGRTRTETCPFPSVERTGVGAFFAGSWAGCRRPLLSEGSISSSCGGEVPHELFGISPVVLYLNL